MKRNAAHTVAAAAAGVVRVEARRRLPATGILWNDAGVIVTANHVVRKDNGKLKVDNKRRITMLQPESYVAEQFRTLRGRLDAGQRPAGLCRLRFDDEAAIFLRGAVRCEERQPRGEKRDENCVANSSTDH